jgi:hypothetical protein
MRLQNGKITMRVINFHMEPDSKFLTDGGGDEPNRSFRVKHRVGPKGNDNWFRLITFDRQLIRVSYSMSGWRTSVTISRAASRHENAMEIDWILYFRTDGRRKSKVGVLVRAHEKRRPGCLVLNIKISAAKIFRRNEGPSAHRIWNSYKLPVESY